MSQENLETVRQAYAAINSGDPSPVLGAVHEDMEFHEPASLPYGGIYRGPEGMGELFASLAEAWDDLHLEIDELLDAGDCVVVRGRLQGRSKSTGTDVDEPYIEVLRLRDGKAVAGWVHMDTARVLEALGREPAPTT